MRHSPYLLECLMITHPLLHPLHCNSACPPLCHAQRPIPCVLPCLWENCAIYLGQLFKSGKDYLHILWGWTSLSSATIGQTIVHHQLGRVLLQSHIWKGIKLHMALLSDNSRLPRYLRGSKRLACIEFCQNECRWFFINLLPMGYDTMVGEHMLFIFTWYVLLTS